MSNTLVHQSVKSIAETCTVPRIIAMHGGRNSRWALALGRLGDWVARSRQRRALGDLAEAGPDLLRDIGMTYAEARREAEKPFWR